MPRHAKTLPVGEDNTRHLSAGLMACCFPAATLDRIIKACGKTEQRTRDLPAVVVAYYIIAMGLFPAVGYGSVLEWLLGGLRWLDAGRFRVSGKSSLSRARVRLGEEPMRRIFEQLARPLDCQDLPGSHWRGLHLVAVDGTTFALQDTESNDRAFGRSSNQHGPAAYPIFRCVVLCEAGTHMVFAAAHGSYFVGETTLARGVLSLHLKPGMLCLADRLFPGYDLWKQSAATGAHLLWRAKTSLNLTPVETLDDGSWIACWLPDEQRKDQQQGILVRVVEYRLADPAGGRGETYRLLTTLMDARTAPALELAALYPERWEVELTIREAKEVLRDNQLTLRSKIADLVRQEFWGLLLAHYLVRRTMALAALERGRNPDLLSFTRSVEIIKSTQAGPVLSFPP